jgi:hypothetical protein
MIIHKAISLRPSLDVTFFVPPKDLVDLRAQYMKENKIIQQESSLSDDQLTRMVITKFANEEVFLDYIFSKPVKDNFTIRTFYNEKHQIIEVLSMSEGDGTPYFLHSKKSE